MLASSGLFEESSDDIDLFEKQEAWISFFESMGGLDGSIKSIPLRELISDGTWERFLTDVDGAGYVNVRVYSGYV